MAFGSFSGQKGDYIDVWLIKITIGANQIDMVFAFFRNRQHTKSMFVPKLRIFPVSLIVCEFDPHRQTW